MSNCKGRLKAVVAGTKWGANHMRAFLESDACDLVAIWSRSENPNSLSQAGLFNVPLYTDFEKMLQDRKPDIAAVAVPERAHEKLTVAALEAGCHVYCEKVLADSREAAQRMIRTARERGRLLNVGYNYRYTPSLAYLADAVQHGELGTVLVVQIRGFGFCLHHLTDYAGFLLGAPQEVVAVLDREPLDDKACAFREDLVFPTFTYCALTRKAYMVRYENGALLQAGATDYSSIEEPAAFISVCGTDGRAEVDDLAGNVRVWRRGRESTVYTPSQIMDRIGLADSCVAAASDFAEAVAEGRPAPIPGEQGLMMIMLEEAIVRSSDSHRWEKVV